MAADRRAAGRSPARIRSAISISTVGPSNSSTSSTNSSPPSRALMSLSRMHDESRRAASLSASSPSWWPSVSLMFLNRSRSMKKSATRPAVPLGPRERARQALGEERAIGQPRERVVRRQLLDRRERRAELLVAAAQARAHLADLAAGQREARQHAGEHREPEASRPAGSTVAGLNARSSSNDARVATRARIPAAAMNCRVVNAKHAERQQHRAEDQRHRRGRDRATNAPAITVAVASTICSQVRLGSREAQVGAGPEQQVERRR